MTEIEYKQYLKDVARSRALIQKYNVKLKQLLEICPHLERVKKELQFEGSYYDKASTDTWVECVVCRMKFDLHTETHSWHG